MIERLTNEQVDKLAEYRDKWLKIGLCCDPCDFEASKRAAIKVYGSAGLDPPQYYFVTDSPLSGAIVGVYLKILLSSSGNQVWNQVRDQLSERNGKD